MKMFWTSLPLSFIVSLAAFEPSIDYTRKMVGHPGDRFIERTDAELYMFGVSYHSNRNVNWNEINQGAALGLAYHYDHNLDLTVAAGTFKDSYNEQATFALGGMRFILGERDGAHATFGLSAGYFQGSGFDGGGIMPVFSVGYNWLDLCMTGVPAGSSGSGNRDTGSRNPQENRHAVSGLISCFLKMRIITF